MQGRASVRWRLGQETSLASTCSNLRSSGSKCTVLKKALATLLGLFGTRALCSLWPLVTSLGPWPRLKLRYDKNKLRPCYCNRTRASAPCVNPMAPFHPSSHRYFSHGQWSTAMKKIFSGTWSWRTWRAEILEQHQDECCPDFTYLSHVISELIFWNKDKREINQWRWLSLGCDLYCQQLR